jgi:hypothetical protein
MARRPLTRPWTAEDTDFLMNLLRTGKKYEQIARQMKRSSAAVRHHAQLAVQASAGKAELNPKSGR